MQPPFDIAADLDTPVSAYLKLAPYRPRFLLESVEGGSVLGRYSFIGFGDALKVRLDADGMHIDGERQPRPADSKAFLDALRGALAIAPQPKPQIPGLPFAGGLVGAAGYDVVRQFERLPANAEPIAGLPEASFVAPESLLIFDHLTRRVAVLHAGGEIERRALRNNIAVTLRGGLPARKPGASFTPPVASLERDEFIARVVEAKESIAAGDVYQLVLSVCFSGETDLDPFETYRALRLLNPSPYMYYCELDDVVVVGSSPEALVKLHDGAAALRPIAGTRPRGADQAADDAQARELLADPKESAEHVMLVDLARNDLGRVAVPGSINVEPYRSIERYSHVMHIVSGVQGQIEAGTDAFDLFAATFPAGTLVGAPKVRAMQLIDAAEPVRRGLYAGTLGYFGHGGNMDQAICIRTLVFQGSRYSFQAGAGIVADSVPEAEHDEVLAKSEILRRALAMAEQGL